MEVAKNREPLTPTNKVLNFCFSVKWFIYWKVLALFIYFLIQFNPPVMKRFFPTIIRLSLKKKKVIWSLYFKGCKQVRQSHIYNSAKVSLNVTGSSQVSQHSAVAWFELHSGKWCIELGQLLNNMEIVYPEQLLCIKLFNGRWGFVQVLMVTLCNVKLYLALHSH